MEWAPHVPVDLPTFVTGLLSKLALTRDGQTCPWASAHGGTGRYLLISAEGGHLRRSNYSRTPGMSSAQP